MNEIENKVIELIASKPDSCDAQRSWSEKIDQLLVEISGSEFGVAATDFISHPLLSYYLLKGYCNNLDLPIWLLIEKFLRIKDQPQLENEQLKLIEEEINQLFSYANDGFPLETAKAHFKDIRLPGELIKKAFIQRLFITENEKLISLFLKYLPIPPSHVFDRQRLPNSLAAKENAAFGTIKELLMNHDNNLDLVENSVVKIQRVFRARQRKRKELEAIPSRHERDLNLTKSTPEQLLNEANKPYVPKCQKDLAQRLINAAEKVKLFSPTIRHLFADSALESIFDDGLYGQRTLQRSYMPFRRAVLDGSDVLRGDYNAICFGANRIDPRAVKPNTVELVLDTSKMPKNPCAFYKLRDFGYPHKTNYEINKITLGTKNLFFSHTKDLTCGYRKNCMNLQFFNDDRRLLAFAEVPTTLLIAYDLEKMHQILALNFFRFIDNLIIFNPNDPYKNHKKAEAMIEDIYSQLATLSDEKLAIFMQEMGSQLTDAMEYNFYGAHKIDFSSLVSITAHFDEPQDNHYSLQLDEFIEALQEGNTEVLVMAQNHLPNLFKSYRFIDYLQTKISHPVIKEVLYTLRIECNAPLWLQKTESEPRISQIS